MIHPNLVVKRFTFVFWHFCFLCRNLKCAPQSQVTKPTKLKVKLLSPKIVMGTHRTQNKVWVCHTLALPFTLKRILRQKKNYGNSNISSCKNIIFKKSSKTNQNPSRYYNSTTNLKFQHKPKYHLSKILR
jgi:hypothetical protein